MSLSDAVTAPQFETPPAVALTPLHRLAARVVNRRPSPTSHTNIAMPNTNTASSSSAGLNATPTNGGVSTPTSPILSASPPSNGSSTTINGMTCDQLWKVIETISADQASKKSHARAHASHSPVRRIVPPLPFVRGQTGYALWSEQAMVYLSNQDLVNVVTHAVDGAVITSRSGRNGSSVAPPSLFSSSSSVMSSSSSVSSTSSRDTVDTSSGTVDKSEWKKSEWAFAWLMTCFTARDQLALADVPGGNAHALWVKIKERFGTSTQSEIDSLNKQWTSVTKSPNEHMNEYGERVGELAVRVNAVRPSRKWLDEMDQINTAMAGLPQTEYVHLKLMMPHIKDFRTWQAQAETIEDAMNLRPRTHTAPSSHMNGRLPVETGLAATESVVPLKPGEVCGELKGNECIKCGALGHRSKECTVSVGQYCNGCGKHGHPRKVCHRLFPALFEKMKANLAAIRGNAHSAQEKPNSTTPISRFFGVEHAYGAQMVRTPVKVNAKKKKKLIHRQVLNLKSVQRSVIDPTVGFYALLDCGATSHLLSTSVPMDAAEGRCLASVKVAGGRRIKNLSEGSITIKMPDDCDMRLDGCLSHESIGINLLSVNQLMGPGGSFVIRNDVATIRNYGGRLIIRGEWRDGLAHVFVRTGAVGVLPSVPVAARYEHYVNMMLGGVTAASNKRWNRRHGMINSTMQSRTRGLGVQSTETLSLADRVRAKERVERAHQEAVDERIYMREELADTVKTMGDAWEKNPTENESGDDNFSSSDDDDSSPDGSSPAPSAAPSAAVRRPTRCQISGVDHRMDDPDEPGTPLITGEPIDGCAKDADHQVRYDDGLRNSAYDEDVPTDDKWEGPSILIPRRVTKRNNLDPEGRWNENRSNLGAWSRGKGHISINDMYILIRNAHRRREQEWQEDADVDLTDAGAAKRLVNAQLIVESKQLRDRWRSITAARFLGHWSFVQGTNVNYPKRVEHLATPYWNGVIEVDPRRCTATLLARVDEAQCIQMAVHGEYCNLHTREILAVRLSELRGGTFCLVANEEWTVNQVIGALSGSSFFEKLPAWTFGGRYTDPDTGETDVKKTIEMDMKARKLFKEMGGAPDPSERMKCEDPYMDYNSRHCWPVGRVNGKRYYATMLLQSNSLMMYVTHSDYPNCRFHSGIQMMNGLQGPRPYGQIIADTTIKVGEVITIDMRAMVMARREGGWEWDDHIEIKASEGYEPFSDDSASDKSDSEEDSDDDDEGPRHQHDKNFSGIKSKKWYEQHKTDDNRNEYKAFETTRSDEPKDTQAAGGKRHRTSLGADLTEGGKQKTHQKKSDEQDSNRDKEKESARSSSSLSLGEGTNAAMGSNRADVMRTVQKEKDKMAQRVKEKEKIKERDQRMKDRENAAQKKSKEDDENSEDEKGEDTVSSGAVAASTTRESGRNVSKVGRTSTSPDNEWHSARKLALTNASMMRRMVSAEKNCAEVITDEKERSDRQETLRLACTSEEVSGSEYKFPAMEPIESPARRCTSYDKNGLCKTMTSDGHLCVFHLDVKMGLAIRKSTLKGLVGGRSKGLFATRQFKKNVVIGVYNGRYLRWEGENDQGPSGPYCCELSTKKNIVIDAAETCRCVTRYANDAKNEKNNNSRLKHVDRTRSIVLKSTRVIEVGEEITTSYGEFYWDDDDEEDAAALDAGIVQSMTSMSPADSEQYFDEEYEEDE